MNDYQYGRQSRISSEELSELASLSAVKKSEKQRRNIKVHLDTPSKSSSGNKAQSKMSSETTNGDVSFSLFGYICICSKKKSKPAVEHKYMSPLPMPIAEVEKGFEISLDIEDQGISSHINELANNKFSSAILDLPSKEFDETQIRKRSTFIE